MSTQDLYRGLNDEIRRYDTNARNRITSYLKSNGTTALITNDEYTLAERIRIIQNFNNTDELPSELDPNKWHLPSKQSVDRRKEKTC